MTKPKPCEGLRGCSSVRTFARFSLQYRQSLKMPEAEELLDLVFYRPLAFLVVKAIYPLRITPNQVTMLSLGAGFVAAFYFSLGGFLAWTWGPISYAVANILDCADGQLAR